MNNVYLGVDIGSTTLKAVLLSGSGELVHSLYQRTRPVGSGKVRCTGRCGKCGACNFGALRRTIDEFLEAAGVSEAQIARTAVTGSQIVDETSDFLPYDFRVSEVLAHVAGARYHRPDCQAILDVGGQDSKAMLFNVEMNIWNSKMSGICAAGTGAFLDSVAAKLAIPVDRLDELADLSSDLEFSSVCAVLSATSINKFKNRHPLSEIIGGACRAQARTIMSGVGEIFLNYSGDIIFQGGVAYNRAVAHFLQELTGNNIIIPEHHQVMGALGAACLARNHSEVRRETDSLTIFPPETPLKSVTLRAQSTRKGMLGRSGDKPLVWRNLFFPPEILNAMDLGILTLETYAALFARTPKKVKRAFDLAAGKGFSGETCSFLRVLEGIDLPRPAFCLSTSQPCQQGERIFRDLIRDYGLDDAFYSLNTPSTPGAGNIELVAAGLEEAVGMLEKHTGRKMDPGRLAAACDYSNQARDYSVEANVLRAANPPLIRGRQAIYFASIFSQLWGTPELVGIQKTFVEELVERRDALDGACRFEDTHRLLWLHLPPFYDGELLRYIEDTCLAPIVFEEVNYIGWDKLDGDDPYRSLARKLLNTGFLDPDLRVRAIVNETLRCGVNGCVLYNHGFGRCSMADSSLVKHLRQALAEIRVPLLVLDGDCVDPTIDPCSTYTKVASFVEALNLQRFGNIFGRP